MLEPAIPDWLVWAAAALGALLLLRLHLRDLRHVPVLAARALLAGRILLLALVLLFVIDPVHVRERADPQAFHIGVVADLSGSMLTADIGNGTDGGRARIDAVREFLDTTNDASPLAAPRTHYRTRVYGFSDTLAPLADATAIDYRPGQSAIGGAMREALEAASSEDPLGALVLLSDGISNTGEDPIAVAMEFGRRGIPIHVIGIGSPARGGDLVLQVPESPVRAEREGLLSFNATIENTGAEPASATVSAFAPDGTRVFREEVAVDAGARSVVTIEAPAPLERQSNLRVTVETTAADSNAANNIGFVPVELEDPDRIRLLLLAAAPDWEAAQLRAWVAANPALELHRVVQIAPGRFVEDSTRDDFQSGEDLSGFPVEPKWYFDFDVILLGSGVADVLAAPLQAALRDFAGNRGGGLVFLGDPKPWTATELAPLLPVRVADNRGATSASQNTQDARPLDFEVAPVFVDQAAGPLFRTPLPSIPARTPLAEAVEPKRGARVIARDAATGTPVLLVQAYGAGRSALWSSPISWQWRLGSAHGSDQHADFWSGLVSWLVLGGKPRVDPDVDGTVVEAGKSAPLGIHVLGADYLPRSDAAVAVEIISSDGAEAEASRRLRAAPQLETPGRFDLSVDDLEPGNYRARYTVDFADGERLVHEAGFAVIPNVSEQGDTRFREAVLRDIARLSGGSYQSWSQPRDLADARISANVPQVREPLHWARHPLWLLLAAAVGLIEWYFRRRGGLN